MAKTSTRLVAFSSPEDRLVSCLKNQWQLAPFNRLGEEGYANRIHDNLSICCVPHPLFFIAYTRLNDKPYGAMKARHHPIHPKVRIVACNGAWSQKHPDHQNVCSSKCLPTYPSIPQHPLPSHAVLDHTCSKVIQTFHLCAHVLRWFG